MDRIIDSAATGDSKEKGKRWTGTWEDTFTNCDINLYTLISGIPKFVYRPIDINNPFPNRNAGINWYDWWSVNRNQEKLKNSLVIAFTFGGFQGVMPFIGFLGTEYIYDFVGQFSKWIIFTIFF